MDAVWDDGEQDEAADALQRWVAAAREDDARRSRTRQAWLGRRAAEESTWVSLAHAWAERGVTVQATTRAGRTVRGRVSATGADFLLAVPTPPGRVDPGRPGPRPGVPAAANRLAVLLPTAAIASLQPCDGGDPGTAPDRPAPAREGEVTADLIPLAAALAELAGNHPWVEVVTLPRDVMTAELRWVGTDVLHLRVGADPARPAYVALSALTEVTLLGGPPAR